MIKFWSELLGKYTYAGVHFRQSIRYRKGFKLKEVVSIPKRKDIINPLARQALDRIKYEIAEELGYYDSEGSTNPEIEYRKALKNMKFEVAKELGIPLQQGYNGDLTSREAGRIGGRLGGKIGGNMVRRMIRYAREKMAEESQNRH